MPQKHIAVETSEIIEQPEGIPLTRAESVLAYILREIGKNRADCPNGENYFLLTLGGTFYPCREDGQVEIQTNQHVDVPHVASDEAESIGDAEDIRQTVGEGLTIGFCPTEELVHHTAVHAQDACHPGGKVVDDRPDEEREEHTGNSLLVEGLHRGLHG